MHSKQVSEFPSHRYHLNSNNQKMAAFQHPPFHNSFPLLLSAGCWQCRPWYRSLGEVFPAGMAALHVMHPSPFPGEGKEPAIHIRRQGFIREQDWESPAEVSNTIVLNFSKCSHLHGRPTDSSSQQVWWVRGKVDKGLFYTEFLLPNMFLAYILCFQTKSLLCFPPAAPPARKISQQPSTKCLRCLSSSQPSKPPEPSCKQTACHHLNRCFPERDP